MGADAMTKLVFGVIDLPYADAASYREVGVRKPQAKATGSMTTGDVADILEAHYGVFQHFYDSHVQDIAEDLADSYEGAAESLMMGAPLDTIDPAAGATEKIRERFHDFLTNKEMDGMVPGVPTQASLAGQSHRFKRAYKKRAARPSFIDTGLYENSAVVEVEGDPG